MSSLASFDDAPSERRRTRAPQRATADQPQTHHPEPEQYLDDARRARADLDNFRRRVQREQAATDQRVRGRCVAELLPVLDTFDRALEQTADSSVADGMRLLQRELENALERMGASSFHPLGERFDPHVHEALAMRADDRSVSGTIVDVFSRGWMVDEMLVRPARVVVAE